MSVFLFFLLPFSYFSEKDQCNMVNSWAKRLTEYQPSLKGLPELVNLHDNMQILRHYSMRTLKMEEN